jgi:hypothetical protein
MPTFTYKSVKSAINLPVAVGVAALVGLAGSPAAAASPAAVASPAAHLRIAPKPLASGLVGETELPVGYKRSGPPMEDWIDIGEPNANPCDMGDSSTSPTTPPPAAHRVHYAAVGFQKGDKSLYETLTVGGDKLARADVAVLTTLLSDCPVLNEGEGEDAMSMKLFAVKLPPLGDASSALRYVIRYGEPATVLRGEMIAIAHHGISISISWDGDKNPNQDELATVATTALAKLKTYKP